MRPIVPTPPRGHRYSIDLQSERRFAGLMTESGPDIMFGLDAPSLAALRQVRLAATLDRVFAAHPYYRRQFAELGILRGDLTSPSDLVRLPVTTKADYIGDPESFRLGGEGAADEEETVVWDVMYTTGSSRRANALRLDRLRLRQHSGAGTATCCGCAG